MNTHMYDKGSTCRFRNFSCRDIRIIICNLEKRQDDGKIQDLMIAPTRFIRIKAKKWPTEDLPFCFSALCFSKIDWRRCERC